LWIEGPIIHKHKGTLYMLYSGGAWWETEYALGYATAQSALGPWTKHDKPVLTKTDAVSGPGHNGLSISPDGSELFVVYHAHAGDYTFSRVAAMDRIVFEKAASGPDLLTIPGAPTSSPQPLPSGAKPMAAAQSDDFSGKEVNRDLWNVYMNYPDEYKQEDGALKITSIDGDFWRSHENGHNVFLQPIPTGDFAIETSVTMESEQTNEQAFLTLFLNEDNHITLAGVHLIGPRIAITHEVKGKPDVSLSPNTIGWPLCLRIEKRGNNVKFFASADGKDWRPVPRDIEIRNWEPRYIGIGAWSPGVDRTIEAKFDYFNVVPLD
jgi:beta-xylosidase